MAILANIKIAQKIDYRAYLRINNIEESLNNDITYLVRGFTDRLAYIDSLNPQSDNTGRIVYEDTFVMSKAKYDPDKSLRKQCYQDLMTHFSDAEEVLEEPSVI